MLQEWNLGRCDGECRVHDPEWQGGGWLWLGRLAAAGMLMSCVDACTLMPGSPTCCAERPHTHKPEAVGHLGSESLAQTLRAWSQEQRTTTRLDAMMRVLWRLVYIVKGLGHP